MICRFGFSHGTLEREQSIVQRGMNIENRHQICQLEQLSNASIGSRQLHRATARLRPHVDNYQFAEAGAIDAYDYLIVNDDYETALGQLHAIVVAERLKVARVHRRE